MTFLKRGLSAVLCLSLLSASAGLAGCERQNPEIKDRTVFDPAPIEKGLQGYYRAFVRAEKGYSPAQQEGLGKGLAFKISLLNATQFNAILAGMAAVYRHKSEYRAAIDAMLDRVHAMILPELMRDKERHPVKTVLDDLFVAFSIVSVVAFAKGYRDPRVMDLKGIARFRRVTALLAEKLPAARAKLLVVSDLGIGAGVVHALYESLQTRKRNPKDVMTAVLGDGSDKSVVDAVVRALSEETEQRLGLLRGKTAKEVTEKPDFCLAQGEARPTDLAPPFCVLKLEKELDAVNEQVDYFYGRYSGDVHKKLKPLATDLKEALAIIQDLRKELGIQDAQETSPEDPLLDEGAPAEDPDAIPRLPGDPLPPKPEDFD